MELDLNRIAEADDYTYGIGYEQGVKYPLFFSIEPEWHVAKIKGHTRIPADRYELGLHPVVTPLTQTYRNKFSWFSLHIEILNVENYHNVYMHIGNSSKDTLACVCMANTCDLTPPKKFGFIGESRDCFERFYKKIEPLLRLNKEKVFININDL